MKSLRAQGDKLDQWLFVSDVDDTLLGDNLALQNLNQELDALGDKIIVVYNSSRPCASLHQSIQEVSELTDPDYLIGALGTQIQIGTSMQNLPTYPAYITQHWDRERVASIITEIGLKPHADQYQTKFKASYDVSGSYQYKLVIDRMRSAGLEVKILFSGNTNLDLIPIRAGKGNAIDFLGQHLGVTPERVVVAGDSGNDIEMFTAPHRGIIVGNADDDLKSLQGEHIYHATGKHAHGILEGLRFWGVLP